MLALVHYVFYGVPIERQKYGPRGWKRIHCTWFNIADWPLRQRKLRVKFNISEKQVSSLTTVSKE